jgi:hypothetical protein
MHAENKKVIETKVATLYWQDEENGILYSKAKSIDHITLDDAKEYLDIIKNDFQHPTRKVLVDTLNRKGIQQDIKNYVSEQDDFFNYFDAVAVYSDSRYSIPGMVISVLQMTEHKPKPWRLFYNKQEAINWLMSIE